MSTIHLTDSVIGKGAREAKENKQRIELADAGQVGLRLRISPAGGKKWYLACRDTSGKYRMFLIGAFPAITISDARSATRLLREKIRQGDDPNAEKRRARALGVAGEVATLDDLIETYTESGVAPRSWAESEARVRVVFSKLLQQPLHKLKAADLQIAADIWRSKSSASFAVRSLRPILKWGAKRHYVDKDVSDISANIIVARDRVLSRDELKSVLIALSSSKSMFAKAMRFILWTVSRRGEAETARWKDINLDSGIWTIPITKNGRPHVLKLPTQARAFLAQHKPKSSSDDDLVFPSEVSNILSGWDLATKSVQKASKTSDWHRHDLRRTGATIMGELGIDPHVIESALNHTVIHSALSGIYNKSRYSDAVAVALQSLADEYDKLCDAIIAPAKSRKSALPRKAKKPKSAAPVAALAEV
jgi:integrase